MTRWRYAVMQISAGGGQRFLRDYDVKDRPRTGRFIAFKGLGVYKIVGRQDGRDGDIGTLLVEAVKKETKNK